MTDNLQQRIETRPARVAVIGLGAIGLPLAARRGSRAPACR